MCPLFYDCGEIFLLDLLSMLYASQRYAYCLEYCYNVEVVALKMKSIVLKPINEYRGFSKIEPSQNKECWGLFHIPKFE